MADIFLSYSQDDLSRVRPVIEALEQQGLSVWWDRKIAPGKTYTQVITEELKTANAVVVVWSQTSVESEWVQIEATQGKRRGILVPLMIDSVEYDIPLEFSLMEAADLTDWDGISTHDELDALRGSISDILSASQIAPNAEPDEVARYIRDRARPTGRTPTDVSSRAEAAYEPVTGRAKIYVSYRRSDTTAYTGRLYDHLANHFGDDSVAMDIDTIQAGVDFRAAIESAVASSSVILVVMGRSWLTDVDETGKRRLDNPDDFVRVEVAAAFERELPVIPVLVSGARAPSVDELPPEITRLAHLQALELSDRRWSYDVNVLINTLERLVPRIS
jgi:hypothetical protein